MKPERIRASDVGMPLDGTRRLMAAERQGRASSSEAPI